MPLPTLLPTGALSGFVRVSFYYDRNPLDVTIGYDNISIAPHVATQRWTYTAPTGRKAWVDDLDVSLRRHTVATTADLASSYITLVTPFLLRTLCFTNTVGDSDRIALAQLAVILPGQTIAASTSDASTGGTFAYHAATKITEFDA